MKWSIKRWSSFAFCMVYATMLVVNGVVQVAAKDALSPERGYQEAIVLLHGLNRSASDFDLMRDRLRQAFPKAQVIALTALSKEPTQKDFLKLPPTAKLSIHQQAEVTYQEMVQKLSNKKLVVVGHSQGGLRGFLLAQKYGSQLKREHNIDIKQLLTIGTPWKGAPILERICNPSWPIFFIKKWLALLT